MSFRRIALVFSVLTVAYAQQHVGSISGIVTDSSGAAVPNASVSITNTDTNLVRKISADGDGNYAAPSLPVGHYSVRVEAPALKAAVREGVTLNVNDTLTVSFKLEVGEVTQTITVESAPLQVELQNGPAQATTINGTQIRELALVTRNYEQLVGLMPGVTSASVDQLYVGVSLPSGDTATIPFSINGARNSSSARLVDGADNIDRGSNQTLLTTPSVDAISEFKVQRNGYSADMGRAGGGQIQVVTKSGTSSFHGDAYEFVRNSAFAADNFYNNATKQNLGPDGTRRWRRCATTTSDGRWAARSTFRITTTRTKTKHSSSYLRNSAA